MTNLFNQAPGDHPLFLTGKTGSLEAILTLPQAPSPHYLAILGHPHSLQGGTMHNKVVTTLARVFKDLNIASVRFNFRGVGLSSGEYDHGLGESEDMLHVVSQCLADFPQAEICFAGFSFGSYVAYRAAALHSHALLMMIAPPVHHYNYQEWPMNQEKSLIIQGEQDDVSPPSLVSEFAEHTATPMLRFPLAGHFFHGQLIDLKAQLMTTIPSYLKKL